MAERADQANVALVASLVQLLDEPERLPLQRRQSANSRLSETHTRVKP
jgi:hypothetical protein